MYEKYSIKVGDVIEVMSGAKYRVDNIVYECKISICRSECKTGGTCIYVRRLNKEDYRERRRLISICHEEFKKVEFIKTDPYNSDEGGGVGEEEDSNEPDEEVSDPD